MRGALAVFPYLARIGRGQKSKSASNLLSRQFNDDHSEILDAFNGQSNHLAHCRFLFVFDLWPVVNFRSDWWSRRLHLCLGNFRQECVSAWIVDLSPRCIPNDALPISVDLHIRQPHRLTLQSICRYAESPAATHFLHSPQTDSRTLLSDHRHRMPACRIFLVQLWSGSLLAWSVQSVVSDLQHHLVAFGSQRSRPLPKVSHLHYTLTSTESIWTLFTDPQLSFGVAVINLTKKTVTIWWHDCKWFESDFVFASTENGSSHFILLSNASHHTRAFGFARPAHHEFS